jgi:hypothetical protein
MSWLGPIGFKVEQYEDFLNRSPEDFEGIQNYDSLITLS